MNFSIAKRMQSFSHAFRGIGTLIETQHNAWIHLVVTITVVAISFLLELSGFEWALIILEVTIVWLAEAMNTAIEFLSDTITELHHPLIGKAKDVAAGAVLIATIGAASIGVIIFWPYVK